MGIGICFSARPCLTRASKHRGRLSLLVLRRLPWPAPDAELVNQLNCEVSTRDALLIGQLEQEASCVMHHVKLRSCTEP